MRLAPGIRPLARSCRSISTECAAFARFEVMPHTMKSGERALNSRRDNTSTGRRLVAPKSVKGNGTRTWSPASYVIPDLVRLVIPKVPERWLHVLRQVREIAREGRRRAFRFREEDPPFLLDQEELGPPAQAETAPHLGRDRDHTLLGDPDRLDTHRGCKRFHAHYRLRYIPV